MELSKLQQQIVDAPYNKVIVLSSAASGKTRVMTEKVRQLLQANIDPRTIAVITFTNMAAEELRIRLGEDYKQGLYVGTIHGLANSFLSAAGIDTKRFLDKEEFDKLFPLVKRNPQCIRHLEWILLDEAQDSDKLQFEFLFDMIKPECFFVCGDFKQTIYRWNGSNPKLLKDLTEKPDVHTFSLNENYRNGKSILNDARGIIHKIGEIDDSIPMRNVYGTSEKVRFEEIIDIIESQSSYQSIAILCRWNKEIEPIMKFLSYHGIPSITFKQGGMTKEQLMKNMMADKVKVLTIHSAKGLEWDTVFVKGAIFNATTRGEEEINIDYVAATRARNNLYWIGKK